MTHMTALLDEQPAPGPARKVTIRQLQQHAAKVIDELAEAEEIGEITRHGQVIARLIPVSPAERALAVPRQPPTIDLTPTSPSPARNRT